MGEPFAGPLDILVRFEQVTGVADTPWLTLSPGISVITGRNNVGKTRMLRMIDDLRRAAQDPAQVRDVPQLRVVEDGETIEVDFRPVLELPAGWLASPRSYRVANNDDPKWVASW